MKLNSYKNYQDKGLLLVIGMVLAYCLMLLPLCGGSHQVESETETAGTMENEFPFAITSNNKFCEGEIVQELRNIINGSQDELGFGYLMLQGRCDYEYERVERALEERNTEWHPGDLNEEGSAQEMPVLTETESHQRFIELCEKYNLPADVIWHTENYYGLKEGTILCIAITETSGGTKGYGKPGCWNYGNVGNNDGGNRRCFPNQGAGLAAIGQTLNNNNLKNNQTIACLHGAGNCIEPNATGKRYATSESGNWGRNMAGCFYSIYGELVDQSTFNLHERV